MSLGTSLTNKKPKKKGNKMSKQSKKTLTIGKNVRINNERDVWRLESLNVDGFCLVTRQGNKTKYFPSWRRVHASKLTVA